jgi:hypothetical protein
VKRRRRWKLIVLFNDAVNCGDHIMPMVDKLNISKGHW